MRTITQLALVVGIGNTLVAGLIIPDSATASFEFNSSYVAGLTIYGSGLPALYTGDDDHAPYSVT